MRSVAYSLALMLVGTLCAQGFESGVQTVLDRQKIGKMVHIDDAATLMMGANRWCYNERNGECGWSDIYLKVEDDRATYEISNPWSELIDISFVDHGQLREDRYICETGFDWVPSVRAYDRETGNAIEGRPLEELRQEIYEHVSPETGSDCFDYVYRGADADAETVTLLQRQYADGVTDPANDAVVTLYFNKDAAEALGWYW